MRRTVYEVNAEKFVKLFPKFVAGDEQHVKIENEGYMPLVLERIGDNEISIAHYYTQNGDCMRDPEITFETIVNNEGVFLMLNALTFTQDNLGLYQEVYCEIDGKKCYRPHLKKEINAFLGQWLSNLKRQGFSYK